ncbi:MAG: ADP-forming succinate--CoA ligase subunit beta [Chloroflexi bacterium]|nr:ADP-forming succinate--CoA ligase subunit beta [Chloroflexota bacterium]
MNLQEYQARDIFARYGLPVPRGEVASTPAEARAVAERLGTRVVVKAQVLVGGRGKAGGVRLADTPQAAEEAARAILGMHIKGLKVRKVLVAEAAEIASEIYLGLVIDRAARRAALMASAEGGVDIEEVARRSPEKIVKVNIHPFLGLRDYQARELAWGIGLEGEIIKDFLRVADGLYRAFIEVDASLAEINPLVNTPQGRFVAVDTKIVLDDNARFRRPQLADLSGEVEENPREAEARQHGLSYVALGGDIGCLVNGAGLAMASMDVIKLYGGEPANFLDVGGGAGADKVATALRLILSDERVSAVLINIFGGITRCDEVARGILEATEEIRPRVPMVTRLVGTNEEEGRRILADADLITAASLAEAAQKAVQLARQRTSSNREESP